MNKRLFGACAIVFSLVVAAVGFDSCSACMPLDESVRNGQTFDGALSSAGDPSAADDAPSDDARAGKGMLAALSADSVADALGFAASLPVEFESEVIAADGFDEVLVAGGGSIVGLLGRGPATHVHAELCAELEEKGWTAVESGQGGTSTFVKAKGRYTWLLLSCSEAGEWVGIVVQVR